MDRGSIPGLAPPRSDTHYTRMTTKRSDVA